MHTVACLKNGGCSVLALLELLEYSDIGQRQQIRAVDPDPDPHGSGLTRVAGSGSGSRKAKTT